MYRSAKRRSAIGTLVLLGLAIGKSNAHAQDLDSFGILAGSTITNTGTSVINGNIGVSPGTAIVGFPPGIVTAPYAIHANDGVAIQAQIDLVTRYNGLQGSPTTINLTGQDLGGLLLSSGVYSYNSAAQLTGTVTLDGQGNPNSRFIFNIGSSLTTASASSVRLINGAQGKNVYFVVGSSATLGTSTAFAGDILALTSITLNTGATINCGAALARNGAVTLDTNTISVCVTAAATLAEVLATETTSPPVTGSIAVASILDGVAQSGGELPPEFANLVAFLSPQELETALAQLSGELGTAVAPAGTQGMRGFLSQISGRLYADGSLPAFPLAETLLPTQPSSDAPGSNTVSVLGYDDVTVKPLASLRAIERHRETLDPRYWTAWASGYGDNSITDGDMDDGTHDRTVNTTSFATGLDYRIRPDAVVGLAFSRAASDFSLSKGFGEGEIDLTQVAIYGRKDFNAAYVTSALSFGWNEVSTERFLTQGAVDRFDASFSTYDIAAQIEAGYRVDVPDVTYLPGHGWVTPYASLQVHSFHTPSYGETAQSGSTAFALNYDKNTTTSTFTEIGARLGRTFALADSAQLTLRTGLAWAHDGWSDESMQASFRSLPGGFQVNGADSNQDFLVVSAGTQLAFDNGLAVSGVFDGRFSKDAQSYSGTAKLSYRW